MSIQREWQGAIGKPYSWVTRLRGHGSYAVGSSETALGARTEALKSLMNLGIRDNDDGRFTIEIYLHGRKIDWITPKIETYVAAGTPPAKQPTMTLDEQIKAAFSDPVDLDAARKLMDHMRFRLCMTYNESAARVAKVVPGVDYEGIAWEIDATEADR